VIVVTDRAQAAEAGHTLPEVAAAVADAGAPLVLFREKDLPTPERRALALAVSGALTGSATRLLVASDHVLAEEVAAAGVHLAATDHLPACLAGAGDSRLAFGRSCHARAGVEAAAAEGASWATLSPIFASPSKPGYGPALGTDALASLPLPCFALGGVTATNAAACLAAGAAGIAVMGAVMTAADPAAAVRELLALVADGPGAR